MGSVQNPESLAETKGTDRHFDAVSQRGSIHRYCKKSIKENEAKQEKNHEQDEKESVGHQQQNKREQTQEVSRDVDSQEGNTRQWTTHQITCIMPTIVLVVGVVVIACMKYQASAPLLVPNFEEFRNKTANLAEEFPAQRSDTWSAIRAAMKIMMKPKGGTAPAAVVLLGTRGSEKASNCLLNRLAKAVNDAYGFHGAFVLDGRHYSEKDTLFKAIEAAIANGHHAIAVQNFEALPAKVVELFHGLCDDQNARHKDVAFIFSLNTNIPANEFDAKVYEATSVWKDEVSKDKLSSLESRLRTKVVIQPEIKPLSVC